jgi:hypothetical protein
MGIFVRLLENVHRQPLGGFLADARQPGQASDQGSD